jgi:hypothetical protein
MEIMKFVQKVGRRVFWWLEDILKKEILCNSIVRNLYIVIKIKN